MVENYWLAQFSGKDAEQTLEEMVHDGIVVGSKATETVKATAAPNASSLGGGRGRGGGKWKSRFRAERDHLRWTLRE